MKCGMFRKFFTSRNNSISTKMKIGRGAVCITSTIAVGYALNKFIPSKLVKSIISGICIILDAIWLFR